MISAHDIDGFLEYLNNCTTDQLHGVLAKEAEAGREEYVVLVRWVLYYRRKLEQQVM
jgi:hypothetical protein